MKNNYKKKQYTASCGALHRDIDKPKGNPCEEAEEYEENKTR